MYVSLGETELERQTRIAQDEQTDSILAQLFPKVQSLPEVTVTASPLTMLLLLALGLWWLGGQKGGRNVW